MPSETRQAVRITSYRLSPEQDEAVRTAAAACGLGPSTFARAAVLRAAALPVPRAPHRPGPDAAALANLRAEVGRCGGLLKLLVLQARDGRVDAAALAQVGAVWREVRDLVEATTAAAEVER